MKIRFKKNYVCGLIIVIFITIIGIFILIISYATKHQKSINSIINLSETKIHHIDILYKNSCLNISGEDESFSQFLDYLRDFRYEYSEEYHPRSGCGFDTLIEINYKNGEKKQIIVFIYAISIDGVLYIDYEKNHYFSELLNYMYGLNGEVAYP